MLGGGSSINFLMYTRASASDFDDWNTEGWSFNDILPLARKMETFDLTTGENPKLHGFDGPLQVSKGGHQGNLGREFIKVAQEDFNIPYAADLQNFHTGHGVSNWSKWISPTTGRRSDAASGYVHPVMATQTNLHLLVSFAFSFFFVKRNRQMIASLFFFSVRAKDYSSSFRRR